MGWGVCTAIMGSTCCAAGVGHVGPADALSSPIRRGHVDSVYAEFIATVSTTTTRTTHDQNLGCAATPTVGVHDHLRDGDEHCGYLPDDIGYICPTTVYPNCAAGIKMTVDAEEAKTNARVMHGMEIPNCAANVAADRAISTIMERAAANMARGQGKPAVPWRRCSDTVKSVAERALCRPFELAGDKAWRLARLLIYGYPVSFWQELTNAAPASPHWEPCSLWESVCHALMDPLYAVEPAVADCIVTAFVRAGLPLHAPFRLHPDRALENGHIPPGPLYSALSFQSESLAVALLDLPLALGLDVNAMEPRVPGAGACNGGSPLGRTNGTYRITEPVFLRVLRRTDRAVINSGSIYINCGNLQARDPNVNVLVAQILWQGIPDGTHGCPRQHVLSWPSHMIANAQPDGDGTDLTAGDAKPLGFYGDHNESLIPLARDLWPHGEFRGALPLIDDMCRWWTRRPRAAPLVLPRLDALRQELITAMRAVRAYRKDIRPALAHALAYDDSGGINVVALLAIVVDYILVPPHDPSRLKHPLLGPD